MRKNIFLSASLMALIWFTAGSAQASMASELAYTKGLSYVQEKNWEKAVSEFSSLQEKDPEWEDAQYYLGLSLNQLKEYEKASAILRKLLQTNPRRPDARVELAYALSHLGKDQEADQELAKVEGMKEIPKPNPKERYEVEKGEFLHIHLATGTQFDSNVVLAPSNQNSSTDPFNNVNFGEVSNTWGIRQNFLGFVEVSPWVMKNLQVGANYTFFHSLNFPRHSKIYKPSDYNLQDHRFGIFGTYGYGKFFFHLPYTLDYMLKGGSLNHYWTGNGLTPSAVYPITSFLYLKGYLRFRNDNFNGNGTDSRRNQDANNLALGLEPSLLFSGGKKGYFTLSYWFDLNRAAGPDWDYFGNLFKAELKFKPLSYYISAAASLNLRNFSNSNSLSPVTDPRARNDKEVYLEGNLGREGKLLNSYLGVSYTINNSNIVDYEYSRLLVSLNIGISI